MKAFLSAILPLGRRNRRKPATGLANIENLADLRKAVSFPRIIRRMRTVTNILIIVAGVVGSGLVAAFTVTVIAEAGALGSCFEESCGYAGLFMAFPLAWFILFSLFLMAMLIWRRKPRRDC